MRKKSYALGLDFGTQSAKMLVLDAETAEVPYSDSFEYDAAFPGYGTRRGVLPAQQAEIMHTSPFMFVEALELAFQRLQDGGVDLGCVRTLKVGAMQHCTIYTDASFAASLAALDPGGPLLAQIGPAITRTTSPMWEDRSPVEEVRYLEAELESYGSTRMLTGNRAELRFPAAQVLKWARQNPVGYSRTAHIFLLSSFLTSILAGKIAPVDTGDGWGTNLNNLDINRPGWSEIVLRVADEHLRAGRDQGLGGKLGCIVPYDSVAGTVSPYFRKRYGIGRGAVVLAGTGDNPATLLGCGGRAVISLGSSYTVNGAMEEIVPPLSGEYNIFGYTPGHAVALTVFSNGGRVHQYFMERYSERLAQDKQDWDNYVSAAGDGCLNEHEKLMLPYLVNESVPLRPRGIVRENFDEHEPGTNIRSLHISQALSLRLHSSHLGRVDALCVVGGGAANHLLRQFIADAFEAATCTIEQPGFAAASGCAISGARAFLGLEYDEAARRFVRTGGSSPVGPLAQNRAAIKILLRRYEMLEKSTGLQGQKLAGGNDTGRS